MKSTVFFFSLLMCIGLLVRSQDRVPLSFLHQKSIQLSFGSQGIGADFNYGILPRLALSAGVNAVPLKANNIFKISGLNSTSKVSADFYNLHLMADYTPFERLRWLRVVGGAAYFLKAKGGLDIYPSDRYTYGDLVLNPEQIGYVNLNIDWKGLAPYVGIGLSGLFSSRAFNVNFDIGTYYLNRPEANIKGTGILSGNASQSGQLQYNVKDYRWLPVLQINFNVKF